MKPIDVNIEGIDIVITHLEVKDDGETIDVEYDHDGSINENELSNKVQKFILEAIENSVKGIDAE